MVKGGYKPANTNMLCETPYPGNILFFLLFIYIEIRRMKKCQDTRRQGSKVKDGIGERFVKVFPRFNCVVYTMRVLLTKIKRLFVASAKYKIYWKKNSI